MERILLVGHGSRDDEGNQEFLDFSERLKIALPGCLIYPCFLEFAEPDIPSGVEMCLAQGATRIVVVPVILLAASHVKLEIPEFLDSLRARYPQVQIDYGRNVGLHKRILDLLEDRFFAAVEDLPEDQLKHTAIVLMGRGSSDSDANGDVYKLARLLWERTGVLTVETCFTGITWPRLPDGIRRATQLGAERIIVLPYFLFTGVLIKRMLALVAELQKDYPDILLTMGNYFGFHSYLLDVVRDRIIEAIAIQSFMNCDLCQYRRAQVHRIESDTISPEVLGHVPNPRDVSHGSSRSLAHNR
jgi:sirohydrochlorin cobaltochelatase